MVLQVVIICAANSTRILACLGGGGAAEAMAVDTVGSGGFGAMGYFYDTVSAPFSAPYSVRIFGNRGNGQNNHANAVTQQVFT